MIARSPLVDRPAHGPLQLLRTAGQPRDPMRLDRVARLLGRSLRLRPEPAPHAPIPLALPGEEADQPPTGDLEAPYFDLELDQAERLDVHWSVLRALETERRRQQRARGHKFGDAFRQELREEADEGDWERPLSHGPRPGTHGHAHAHRRRQHDGREGETPAWSAERF